jgi:hypothetical protein
MNNVQNIILSTAYLPPIPYFSFILRGGNILTEQMESYRKQSYRNRCHIYSANGLLSLNIPVVRHHQGPLPIKEARIDYSYDWQIRHWRAIVSSYKSSAYFDYYADDFAPFYHNRRETYLLDFNMALMEILLDLISIRQKITLTDTYIARYSSDYLDLREVIDPKKVMPETNCGQYHQVFAHKFGFIGNLSVIDLLFNEGPSSSSLL